MVECKKGCTCYLVEKPADLSFPFDIFEINNNSALFSVEQTHSAPAKVLMHGYLARRESTLRD